MLPDIIKIHPATKVMSQAGSGDYEFFLSSVNIQTGKVKQRIRLFQEFQFIRHESWRKELILCHTALDTKLFCLMLRP